MADEVNHRNNGATLILDAVNYEDSEHTFYLGLPPYSEKDKLLNFINDRDKGWPSLDFSFSDGNLTGVENLFHLKLGYALSDEDDDDDFNDEWKKRLSVSMDVKLKLIPWKVNEKLDSIIINFARISFVNKLDGCSSDADPDEVSFNASSEIKNGFRIANSQTAYLDWNRNYSRIKITVNVSKRAEGSADIVTSKPMMMMAFSNSNVLPGKVNTSFSEYFLAENLSDCKVEVGEMAFPAHRLVLAGISETCKRMFLTDMIENENRVWKINDFEPEVVQEFLEYAYKGTCKNLTLAQNMGILMDLFRMGHRYDVVPLKVQCEELLKNLINSENVVDLFEFGFLYEMESLMDAAKAYFTRFKQQILPNSAALNDFQKKYSVDIIYKLTIE